MNKSKTDVLVVGAGPAGLLSAREAARRGAQVVVLEEHGEVGSPNHCAGILSVEGLRRLGVEPSKLFVQQEIKGGRVYSPNGTEIEIRSGRTRAYAIDRAIFDKKLAEEAIEAGAEIWTHGKAERLLTEGERVTGVRAEKDREIQAKVTIDAEGPLATLARSVGMVSKRTGVLAGINCEIPANVDVSLVEVWIGHEVAPGFFAWVVPLQGQTRCGLGCSEGNPLPRLESFLEHRFNMKPSGHLRRGFILTGGPVKRSFMDGLVLVGDAAGQTKATTGGGVILGGFCGVKAGEVAAEAVESGDASARVLSRYEAWWKRELGMEFSSMSSARRIFDKLSDEKLDQLFAVFEREDMKRLAESYVDEGDMDFQRGIMRKALGNAAILNVLIRILGRMIVGMLKEF